MDQVKYGLGNRTDVTDTQLVRALNWTLLHVTQPMIYRHVEMMEDLTPSSPTTLTTGTSTYTLPSRAFAVVGVKVTHPAGSPSRWLDYREPSEFDRFAVVSSNSQPTIFTRGPGTSIRVHQPPAADWNGGTITVRAFVEPTPFTVSNPTSQTSPLRSIWDEVLIVGAKARLWRELGSLELSEAAKGEFTALVNEVTLSQRIEAEARSAIQVDLGPYRRMA